MDVNRTEGAAPTTNNGGGSGGREHPHKEQPDQTPGEDERASNAVEIDGLAAEITPRVQAALESLAAEIEPLRAKLSLAEDRERQLREDLAKHAFLPVPGRREFIRELNHVLNHLKDLTVMPSLAVIHVATADEVRRRHGRDALDRLLVHVADGLGRLLQPTDVLGNLGGNDFAIILLGLDADGAKARVAGLKKSMSRTPFSGAGQSIEIEFRTGVASIDPGVSAESVLRAADRNLTQS